MGVVLVPELGRGRVSRRARNLAAGLAVALAFATVVGLALDALPAPTISVIVPICATLWFAGGSLTALVLLGQFAVTGATGFLVFACAYAFAALLAIPYVASIPGAQVQPFAALADFQMTGAFWATWHIGFAALVCAGFLIDPRFTLRPRGVRQLTRMALTGLGLTLAVVALAAAAIWFGRGRLPIIVTDGHPTAIYRLAVAPAAALANLAACAVALVRGRAATPLSVWLALATFAAALDATANGLSRHVFSYAWYLSKVQTTLTTTIVVGALLVEIALLYGRLAELATRDALTGLSNRRGLDEHLRTVHDYARRRELGLALLLIDIDHFKRYNDRYGHAQGDDTLRRVAALMAGSATRGYDIAARYGGEEFVVALFDVSKADALAVAERLRKRVEDAHIPHDGVVLDRVSISVGIAQTGDAGGTTLAQLFEGADRALYGAKAAGRNRCVAFANPTQAAVGVRDPVMLEEGSAPP